MLKFVENIVAFSLRNHVLIFFMTFLLVVFGIIAYKNTPIEAFPDVTNTRARIITQWAGRSAEEVEKFITLPIMKEVNTIPKKTEVRSISLFGLSVVTVLFDDGVDDFYAQQYAANRLQSIDLPEGAEAEVEPPYGATGEIFRYVIKAPHLELREVTALQEWVIERELLAIQGVADVVSFGGEEKIYEIQVDPVLLSQYALTPIDVYEAVSNSNINVGGDIIEKGLQAFVVRGVGLLESIEDIENILIANESGTHILVKHVADVVVSSKPKLGQVGLDDEDDLVQGIIIMLRGENPSKVIESIKERIEYINYNLLPKGVKVYPFHDRSELVNTTVRTVTTNLIEGMLLVSLIVFVFLYNWKISLIISLVIPLSFLFALIMLRIQNLPANLISMGAIDFGLLLKGCVIIVERIFVDLDSKAKAIGFARFNKLAKGGLIRNSSKKVVKYVFVSQLILIIALFPIFSFQKVEGKMFTPLAFTLGYAMLGALILSFTFVPALCKVMLVKNIKDKHNKITVFFNKVFFSMFQYSFRAQRFVIVIFVSLTIILGISFHYYGSEFIPQLNEGALYVRATLPNSVSLRESVAITKKLKEKIRSYQEVKFVLTQTGRPNDGTDPTGFFNVEFHIELLPEKQWKRKITKEQLVQEMRNQLEIYPGVYFAFSQPIMDNVEEYVAGVKSSLVVNIYGNDLYKLESIATDVAGELQDVRGITDLNIYKNIGLPELRIELCDWRMAFYGVYPTQTQTIIEMAIGGKAATQFYEEEKIFEVRIRLKEEYRKTKEDISNILIPTTFDTKVPLYEIADIYEITGPAFIYRKGNSRYIAVGFSVEGRDLGSVIKEAKERVSNVVNLPHSYRMEWAGEFESKERASKQLAIIVPACLLLIAFLLYMNFGNVKDTLISLTTMPYAFIGGFISLLVTSTVFNISAGIGFIILFGVNTIFSLVLITSMKDNLQQKMNIKDAVFNAVKSKIRPVIMIGLMGAAGLLPAALSTGMGSEIQKPIAIMIVGGLIICMIMALTVLPQVFYMIYKSENKDKNYS